MTSDGTRAHTIPDDAPYFINESSTPRGGEPTVGSGAADDHVPNAYGDDDSIVTT